LSLLENEGNEDEGWGEIDFLEPVNYGVNGLTIFFFFFLLTRLKFKLSLTKLNQVANHEITLLDITPFLYIYIYIYHYHLNVNVI
jgi:hypothetical protein